MKFKNHFTWRFEGITHFGEFVPLSDFDKTEYKHVQLKDNEFLSRYKTDAMLGLYCPLIKINHKSQRVYFLQSSPDTDRAWFDGKGIPAKIHVRD